MNIHLRKRAPNHLPALPGPDAQINNVFRPFAPILVTNCLAKFSYSRMTARLRRLPPSCYQDKAEEAAWDDQVCLFVSTGFSSLASQGSVSKAAPLPQKWLNVIALAASVRDQIMVSTYVYSPVVQPQSQRSECRRLASCPQYADEGRRKSGPLLSAKWFPVYWH